MLSIYIYIYIYIVFFLFIYFLPPRQWLHQNSTHGEYQPYRNRSVPLPEFRTPTVPYLLPNISPILFISQEASVALGVLAVSRNLNLCAAGACLCCRPILLATHSCFGNYQKLVRLCDPQQHNKLEFIYNLESNYIYK